MPVQQAKYPAPPSVRRQAKVVRWPLTPAEAMMWQRLKTKQPYRLMFRHQHPIHHFIVDFYCHVHGLVIEIDGGIHEQQQEQDDARSRWFTDRGFRMLRFTNAQVTSDLQEVLRKIAQACGVEQPGDNDRIRFPPPGG